MVTRGRRADAATTFLRTVGQRLPLLVPDDIRHAGGSLSFAPEARIGPQSHPTAQERGRSTRTVGPWLPSIVRS